MTIATVSTQEEPGLAARPAALNMSMSADGVIDGLM